MEDKAAVTVLQAMDVCRRQTLLFGVLLGFFLLAETGLALVYTLRTRDEARALRVETNERLEKTDTKIDAMLRMVEQLRDD